jgi:CPA2 family monovalent cation:H+ antiporter-2
MNLPASGLRDHVVIAGCGRVGQCAAQVLQRLSLNFVIIELDARRVEQAKAAGWPVIFGDASQTLVLEAARVAHARLLLVTAPDLVTAQTIVERGRRLHATLHIVARAEGVEQMRVLHGLGVYEVVQPEFEAGLEMTRQALFHLQTPAAEIQRFTDMMHQELYAPLYQENQNYRTIPQLYHAPHLLDLTWVALSAGSPMIGRTPSELGIRSQTGATVVGVIRGDTFYPNPSGSYRFSDGDLVAVIGERAQLDAFRVLAVSTPTPESVIERP